MAEDVKKTMSRVSRMLRQAKDKGFAQLGKVKEKAQKLSGAAGSPSQARGDPKVEQLMALGFSAEDARQGLRSCGGNVEFATMWLLDQRQGGEALQPGSRARVFGLRQAAELNGVVVRLHRWDAATQRWIVSLPDSSVKSIRGQNLEPVQEPAVPAAEPAFGTLDRKELKTLAKQMLESAGESVTDESLDAMSAEDLFQLVHALQMDSAEQASYEASASAGYAPGPAGAEPEARRSAESKHLESERLAKLELEEARLKSLAEAQAKRAKELEEREEALRKAEENLEQRRAEVAQAVRVPFVAPQVESPTARAAMEVEREELRRLRMEVDAAAKEMMARQQAAKQREQERELQLLEEESVQLRMASTLREEEARLEMQRRSLGLLQKALLKGGAAAPQSGCTEHSLDDESREVCDEAAASAGADEGADHEVWDLDWAAVEGRGEQPEKSEAK